MAFLLFLCWGSQPTHAQTKRKITGKITLSDRNIAPGVTISVKGSTQIALSDNQGHYQIEAADNAILIFSQVGTSSQEIAVNNRQQIDVMLAFDVSQMDEVVVIGYGTQKKRDVTGAISSVTEKAIIERQPLDVYDAMQGQVPGLQIAQESGRPGAGSSVRIRGIATFEGGAEPLYIVDGAQGVNIDGINPADIASIEVLRDAASAAIYGARSANGVIIITTKKGKEGQPQISARYLQSFSKLANKIPQANAAERRLFDFKRTGNWSSQADSLNPSYNADNDMQDLLTRTAVRNQIDLSVSGANKALSYYGSAGYLRDQGIIINSWANIIRGRFNMDYRANDRFSMGTRVQLSYSEENRINEGNTLNQAIQRPPTFRVYMPDGTLAPNIGGRRNPVAEALLRKNEYANYDASIYNYLSYQVFDALKFTVDLNARGTYNSQESFVPKLLSNSNDQNEGRAQNNFRTYWQTQSYFNYDQSFNDHTINAVLGFMADQQYYEGASIGGRMFLSEEVTTMNSAQELLQNQIYTDGWRNSSASVFGRLGYSYKGRYLINSNLRYDGSSRFGADNRWGFFPSISAGWRFSDESFMKFTKKWVDDAKIRISYGLTGNDRIPEYMALQRYEGGNFYNGISGVAPSSAFGNSTLSWESTKQFNLGADLSFFDGRMSIVADWYNKITDDLLYNAPLPVETGFNTVRVNVGSIQNRGFEFIINGLIVQNKNWKWDVSYNMTFNNNTVRKLSDGVPISRGPGDGVWLVEEGGRLGNFYGWQALGIYQYDESNAWSEKGDQLTPVFDNAGGFTGYTLNGTPYTGEVRQLTTRGNTSNGGDVIWKDLNGDGSIDDADRMILGNAQPKWTAGFAHNISYKNIQLSFNLYGGYGGMIYNRARQQGATIATTNATPDPGYIHGAWAKQGDVATWYRPANNSMGNARELSSMFLEDASFIRLRNLRLTYNLSTEWIRKMKLQQVGIYFFGNNLLTWTDYSWYDPEVAFNNALEMGLDNGRYPRKREMGFGININF